MEMHHRISYDGNACVSEITVGCFRVYTATTGATLLVDRRQTRLDRFEKIGSCHRLHQSNVFIDNTFTTAA